VTAIDRAFETAREPGSGGAEGFARWMSLVERPLRASLRRFARAVDAESVLQEALLRMWIVAQDASREIAGENASLRFALRVARLVALEEVRRAHLAHLVALDGLEGDEPSVHPPPVEDAGLLRAIRDCLERLTGKPREAMLTRLRLGHASSDRDLAASVGMAVNTFLQNIVRARKSVALCLERKGT
jgi:DNA-directed RNA polymerase specialized sigma24 family protein